MSLYSYQNSESFSRYLQEISKFPLLNIDQEKALVNRLRDDNLSEKERLNAKTKLINSNLRLVISIAKNYQSSDFLLEDLVSSGNVGLINSVEKYDYNRGMKFASYARWFIQREIIFTINDLFGSILIPRRISGLLRYLSRFEGTTNSSEELSKLSGVPLDKVNLALTYKIKTHSLNVPISDEDEEAELMDFIPDYRFSPEKINQIDNQEISELLNLLSLSEREKTILNWKYGLDGEGCRTLEEISNSFDVTRERIRQIDDKIIQKIRKNNKVAEKLKDYFYENINFNEVLS
jgi:RNA polymerase primary sigma factor